MKYKEKRLIREPLLWSRTCERPMCIPVGRPRGAKAEGLRYEKSLATTIKGTGPLIWQVLHGQWFQFNDGAGEGYCQTDILVFNKDVVFVLECKLTWTEGARDSLLGLYVPIVSKAFRKEARGIVACENLVRGMPWTTKIVSSMDEALQASSVWPSVVLHWRRKTPLWNPFGEKRVA
jgi:hypothetical protein